MPEEMVNEATEQPKEETKIGLWRAICTIFMALAAILEAIAKNIVVAGPTEMSNMFRVFFRSFLATIMVTGGGWFLWVAAFVPKESLNEHTGVIVGFVTGTFITFALSFYFGGQDRQKKKEETDASTSP